MIEYDTEKVISKLYINVVFCIHFFKTLDKKTFFYIENKNVNTISKLND